MKWKKLGRIFNPVEHKLANNCFEFAQSPQVLVFDDFIRIYFSTRERDRLGKYLSHVSFVDFKEDLKEVIKVSAGTVIELGRLGTFDEHGIFPVNILRSGNKILAYTGGWNRKVSVSTDGSIGMATSNDNGMTFTKFGEGPVLTSSLHEPFLVGDPFVYIHEKVYHMWYIFGTKWVFNTDGTEPDRIYKIGHATSVDGIVWHKEGKKIIADKLNMDECQALPAVIRINGKYHMYFCYRQAIDFRKNRERGYRIGYAWSNDLVSWHREDENVGIDVSDEGWDRDMLCYPHVFNYNSKIYMLYNGNEFGRYGFGLAILESDA